MRKAPVRVSRLAAPVLLAALLAVTAADLAHAACNLIPGTTRTFSATLGTTNRPFAAPGESLELALRPCDTASPGLTEHAADHVVSVLFTPPNGPHNVVVIAADCQALGEELRACGARADVDSVTCVPVDPETDPQALALVTRDVCDPTGACRPVPHLSFRFPDTDAVLLPPGDGRTLSGPATVAVTRQGDHLPCALSSIPCSAAVTRDSGDGQPRLVACADDFFDVESPACATAPTLCSTGCPNATFGHFTALPPPNDYRALCTTPRPPCLGGLQQAGPMEEFRFALDQAGNLLAPVDWRGVLVRKGRVPVPRLLRGIFVPPPSIAIRLPGRSFSRSYSPEGGLLPPIFEPQADTTMPEVLTLFGSSDAPYTILRIARRNGRCAGGPADGQACTSFEDCPDGTCPTTCAGGISAGTVCNGDAECPGSTCGSLFDLSGLRFVGEIAAGSGARGVGPVVLTPSSYAFEAQTPVPLEGLVQSANLFAFVVGEDVAERDLNGDGDTTDSVVTLARRDTGQVQPIGAEPACGIACCPDGRAVARVEQPPFSFPAVAVEGDVVAFLEPEAATNTPTTGLSCDLNGDGDISDTLLRVFRLGPTEVTAGMNLAADAASVINGQSVIVSHGLVFFRAGVSGAAPCSGGCRNPRTGAAGACAVLGVGRGKLEMTGGGGGAGGIQGDLCADSHRKVSITGSQRVSGTIRLATGATLHQKGSKGSRGLGRVRRNDDLADETAAAVKAAAEAAALRCTQTFTALKTSRTITGAGGLNVVCVRDVTLKGHELVRLAGGAADTFVINVSGRFALTGGSRIVAHGIPASAVLYNVIGTGQEVALNGNASIDGTILALERDIALTPGSVDGDVIGGEDISLTGRASVRCPDPEGDCEVTNTALHVLNASTSAVTPLCAAGAVSVADGNAAFLRPEEAGSGPGCPPGPDLNGDGDTQDEVVHLSRAGGAAENLGCAATATSLSTDWLAALVSETDQVAGGIDLNGDGDTLDDVVEVHRVTDGAGPCSAPTWRNVGQAADSVDASGSIVAFFTPEAAQGGADLNGDGDDDDRVLQLYDAATGELTSPGLSAVGHSIAAEDVVLGESAATLCGHHQLIAFRASECAQAGLVVSAGCPTGGTDFNGDGDADDEVLDVYDAETRKLITDGQPLKPQAVTPCELEACDPRRPYRVFDSRVKFLTLESEQGGQDLNGDGDATDLILQSFDLCTRLPDGSNVVDPHIRVIGAVDPTSGTAGDPLVEENGSEVFVSTAGRCVANDVELLVPGSCLGDFDCPPGATCEPADFPVVAASVAPTTTTVPTTVPPSSTTSTTEGPTTSTTTAPPTTTTTTTTATTTTPEPTTTSSTSTLPTTTTTETPTTTTSTTLAAPIQCCLQSSPMGAFDSCVLVTVTACGSAGGIDVGPGSCVPNPCAGVSTTTTALPTTTTSTSPTSTTTMVSTSTTTLITSSTTTLPGNITLTIPGQFASGIPLVGVGRTVGVIVTLSRPAPPGGVDVTLTTDDPAIATVAPATLNIPAGEVVRSASTTGVGDGTTTLRGSAPVFAQGTVNVQVTNNTVTLFLGSAAVGKNLQVGTSGSLGTPAPAGNLQVTITSGDATRLSLSTGATAAGSESVTVQVGAGTQNVPTFFVQSLADSGSVDVTASAPGYAPDTKTVALRPSGFVFYYCAIFGTCDFTTTSLSGNTPLYVAPAALDPATMALAEFQAVRGGLTVSVPVTSAAPAVGTIAGSPAVFNPGESINTSTAFAPGAAGTSVLTVGVPADFGTPSNVRQLTATVTAPGFSIPASLGVGRDLQVPVDVYVNATPPAPTTVTVSVPSDATSIATVSTDGTVAGGSSATLTASPGTPFVGRVFLQGRGPGDTTLTVQAAGYASTASAVTVQPSGFVFYYCVFFGTCDFTTTSFSDDTPLYVAPAALDPATMAFAEFQAVRGGLTVSVPVTSAAPAVGTIAGGPAVFNPGDSLNTSTAFAPGAAGASVLTVGVPAGFGTPSNVRQLTATVTAPGFSIPASLAVGRDLQVPVDVYVNTAPPAPTTVTVSVPNDTTSIATVSTNGTVAGGSSATLTASPGTTFVGTVFVQGRGLGDTTLTAQAPGYASTASAVTVQPSGFVFYYCTIFGTCDFTTTTLSDDTALYVVPAVLDPTFLNLQSQQAVRGGLTVSVPVTSATPAVGTIAASPAVFNPGESINTSTAFAPGAAGTSVLTVGVPAGFSTPGNARQLTATVTAPSFTNIPASIAVGRDLQVPVDVYVNTVPLAPTTVTVSVPSDTTSIATVSTNGTVAGGSSATLIASPGTTFVGTVFVQGRGLGETTLTVQAPGYTSTASAVTVQPSGFVFYYCTIFGTCDFTTTTFSDDTPLYVVPAVLDPTFLNFQSQQAVRGGLTVSVPVTSAAPAVGTIAGSPAVFNPGESINASTAFAPGAAGTSVLTVGVPAGFSTPSNVRQLTATVAAPSFSNIPASLAVGRDLQVPVDVYVNAAPPAPTTVTVSVPNDTTSVATVSTDATLAGGSSATLTASPGTTFVGTVLVQGRGLGDTTLTVQAAGYASTVSAVTVQPSGFVFYYCTIFGTCDFTTTTASDDTALYVVSAMLDPTFLNFQSQQAVRGGLTVSVGVTSATPAVGTIAGSPAVFNPGESINASTAFAPGAAGTSVLTVGVPASFSTPSNARQLTATVQ